MTHNNLSLFNKALGNNVVHVWVARYIDCKYQSMCTTIFWLDRINDVRITKCHEKWMTTRSSFIGMTSVHDSLDEFMDTETVLIQNYNMLKNHPYGVMYVP